MDDKRDDQPHGGRDSTPTTEASFAPTEIVSPIVRTKGAIAAVATLDGTHDTHDTLKLETTDSLACGRMGLAQATCSWWS